MVTGQILTDACRYYEFRVVELDDREERTAIVVETVAQGRQRDFFGFNRAKHAVVEAAILATRADWLAVDEMLAEFRKLAVVVDKTGGPRERAAFTLLHRHVREIALQRGSRAATRVARPHDQPHDSYPNTQPFALWPSGLGPAAQPAVRRRRADDRIARDRTCRRTGDSRGTSRAHSLRGSTSSSTIFRLTTARVRNDVAPRPDSRRTCPAEHVGLGVGTQLCLAVARAVLLAGRRVTDSRSSSSRDWTRRGLRSGIGLHGFEHGGLIVDGGRGTQAAIPPAVGAPAVSGRLVNLDRATARRARPAWTATSDTAFADLPPITPGRDRLALPTVCFSRSCPRSSSAICAAFGAALSETASARG